MLDDLPDYPCQCFEENASRGMLPNLANPGCLSPDGGIGHVEGWSGGVGNGHADFSSVSYKADQQCVACALDSDAPAER